MQVIKFGSIGRLGLLSLAAILAGAFLTSIPPISRSPTVEASVASDKEKDKNKDKQNNRDDHDEDHVLNGQVLAVNTLKDPPELIVGSVDGPTTVRVLKTDEIATNGVGVGDYVELNGEKVNEQLFEATQISVSERYSGAEPENDNEP